MNAAYERRKRLQALRAKRDQLIDAIIEADQAGDFAKSQKLVQDCLDVLRQLGRGRYNG